MLSSTAHALPPNPGFDPPDIGGPPPFVPPAHGFDWSVAPRFGGNFDSRGLIDYHWNAASATYYSDYVHPTALTVQFNGCPSPTEAAGNAANPPTTTSTYTWEEATPSGWVPVLPVDGTPAASYPTRSCAFTHTFGIDPVTAKSTHSVRLTITQPTNPPTSTTYTNTVAPHDRLIVSLGDSYASGEGNPDIPQQVCSVPLFGCVSQNPQWEDARCHRSSNAAPAQAALALAEADPHQSVTFLSFACSGATINTYEWGGANMIDPYYGRDLNKPIGTGILGQYAGTDGGAPGTDPDYSHPLPSQIDQMTTAVGARHIDALLADGGGNDIGFGNIAQFCIVAISCQNEKVFNGDPQNAGFVTLDQRVRNDAATLAANYQQLADAICVPDSQRRCTRDVGKVYLSEYPDPTRADDGNFCTNILDDVIPGVLFPVLAGAEAAYELSTGSNNHIDVAPPAYGFSMSNNSYTNDPPHLPQSEVGWAGTTVLSQLNGAVQQGVADGNASTIPWTYVGGIASAFSTHGYCANDSWIRRAPDAVAIEGPWQVLGSTKTKGTLHPNEGGQRAIAQQLLSVLKPDLIPPAGGSNPLPVPFFSPSLSLTDQNGTVTATSATGADGWLTGCSGSGCVANSAVFQMGVFDSAGMAGAGLVMNGSPLSCSQNGVTTGVVKCKAALRSDGTYTWSLSFAADGLYSLAFDVRDNNGTHGGTNREIKVDLEDPSLPTATVSTSPSASGWYTTPVDVTFDASDPPGGSGLQGIAVSVDGGAVQMLGAASQVPAGGSLSGAQLQAIGDGSHTISYQSVDWAGRSSAPQTLNLNIETAPPTVNCGAPDGTWHADDVSIQCTATDTLSSLGTDRDGNPLTTATFTLSTSVAAGTETTNATTDTQQACNVAGNCATVGPIGGNMVDKEGPTITVNTPADGGTFYLNQPYHADYSCADLSGVASCAGSLADGASVDTSRIGPASFTVNATDNLGQTSQVTTNYNVVGDLSLTTLSSSPNPSTYGQSVTFTATVAPAPGSPAGTPTGSVSFDEQTTDYLGNPTSVHLGSGTVGSTGVATFATTSLHANSFGVGHLITATYAGDATYGSSTSSGLVQNVNPEVTTTTVSSSVNPSNLGQAVTFTATVSPTNGFGYVTFTADGATMGGCVSRPLTAVNGTFQATCTTSSLTGGTRVIAAGFSGFFDYGSSTGVLSGGQQVTRTTPTITWANPADIVYGTALNPTQLDATASVPGTFVYGPAAGTLLGAGSNQVLSVSFTPTDSSNYSPASATVHINVTKATPIITWATPGPIIYGAALGVTQLNATASVPGAFVYSPAAGTVLGAGPNQALSVTFTPADTADYNTAMDSVTITVEPLTTTMLYSGPQFVNRGSTLTPAAKLASPITTCRSGQPVAFTLDVNPITGAAGPYIIETAATASNGKATGTPVATGGWQEGVYTLTASFGPTANCVASSDSATLAVASHGDSAAGGGWYSLSGIGRVNFGFTVRPGPAPTSPYTGHLLMIGDHNWRLSGAMSSYSKTSASQGFATGTGDLYWWNQALAGGLGDWQLAQSGVSFTTNFDQGSNLKLSTCDGTNGQGCLGIQINYSPVPSQPGVLPNSPPQPIKLGRVKMS